MHKHRYKVHEEKMTFGPTTVTVDLSHYFSQEGSCKPVQDSKWDPAMVECEIILLYPTNIELQAEVTLMALQVSPRLPVESSYGRIGNYRALSNKH